MTCSGVRRQRIAWSLPAVAKNSVSVGPGQTASTLTPVGCSSSQSARLSRSTYDFVAA